jgi:hypothetical protein
VIFDEEFPNVLAHIFASIIAELGEIHRQHLA